MPDFRDFVRNRDGSLGLVTTEGTYNIRQFRSLWRTELVRGTHRFEMIRDSEEEAMLAALDDLESTWMRTRKSPSAGQCAGAEQSN